LASLLAEALRTSTRELRDGPRHDERRCREEEEEEERLLRW
jgi:hypothetical protein